MLEGKTALITGSGRGIGRAISEAFAQSGADVIAHARQESIGFRDWCTSLAVKYDVKVLPIFFDLTDSAAMRTAVRALISAKVPVNVLVNNAGVAHGGLFQMTSLAKIREVFEVNLFAHMELTQQLIRYMIKGGGGSIINMGSVMGQDLPIGSCAYGVSKAALMAFTQTLAAECGPLGVRVNALAPGLTRTDMAGQMEAKAEQTMLNQCAMKRLALPEEIANAAVFLASDKASFINGQIVRVDGGKA